MFQPSYCFFCMQKLEDENRACPRCGQDSRACGNRAGELPPSLLGGRYHTGKALGRGSFGPAYLGLDLQTDSPVVLREYFPAGLASRGPDGRSLCVEDKTFAGCFEREQAYYRQAAEAQTGWPTLPGLSRTRDSLLANGTLYIVTDYVEGETLRERVKGAGGVCAAAAAHALLRPVFSALGILHGNSRLHRHVNPDHIRIRTDTGEAVLLESWTPPPEPQEERFRRHADLPPGYTPVEMYSPHAVHSARTDVYALSATLYFAVTGRRPAVSVERAVGGGPLPLPSALGFALPPAYEAALMTGLAVRAEDRYPDVPSFYAALDRSL